ncbi:hypothetical protein [Xaviernesmea oryzae]|uniref:hypothetical protein n=1 Tax=Xaviernesmea oryzae TaxID=464029 RepID=UPI001113B24F|nr:hypothetical protein [Xaviernesmea oryzae]
MTLSQIPLRLLPAACSLIKHVAGCWKARTIAILADEARRVSPLFWSGIDPFDVAEANGSVTKSAWDMDQTTGALRGGVHSWLEEHPS